VEAVEYVLLPASYKVSRFRVCFRFLLLSSKCFCFHFQKKLTASTAFASSFRFDFPASCFMKNASVSDSSKSQMLSSSLPLPAYFFKVLPLPQEFNRFLFHISVSNYPIALKASTTRWNCFFCYFFFNKRMFFWKKRQINAGSSSKVHKRKIYAPQISCY